MLDRVERERMVQADCEEVWDAITTDGWLAEEVALDLSPGGEAEFRSGEEVRRGWIEEALAPRRMTFWWAVDGEAATRVELTLTPLAEGTRVRVVETRPLELLDLAGIPLPGAGGASYGPALVAA